MIFGQSSRSRFYYCNRSAGPSNVTDRRKLHARSHLFVDASKIENPGMPHPRRDPHPLRHGISFVSKFIRLAPSGGTEGMSGSAATKVRHCTRPGAPRQPPSVAARRFQPLARLFGWAVGRRFRSNSGLHAPNLLERSPGHCRRSHFGSVRTVLAVYAHFWPFISTPPVGPL